MTTSGHARRDRDRLPGRPPGLAAVPGLARACHPGPTAAVTVLVTALAAAAGRDAAGCGLVAAAVLAGQLSIGWCNDAVDAGRDVAAGRTGKPVADGTVSVRAVWTAAAAALALCVPLSLASGLAAGAVHLAGVAAAWAYDLRLKATVLSWLPYAVGFGSLPPFVTLGLPGRPWPAWWAVLAAALLGCGAHLANVLPDIPADLATGVRGWPQRIGAARVRALIPVPLLLATGLLVFGPPGPPGAGGWAALVGAGAFALGGLLLGGRSPKAPFAAAVAVAAVAVVLLLARGTGIAVADARVDGSYGLGGGSDDIQAAGRLVHRDAGGPEALKAFLLVSKDMNL
ncbi:MULTISPECIES: UbiA family prenyltransferase [Streptosporangium]|uniref:4-hydroxybenzoate polyprenyltransferase n=1 Tax=Streptosporangium brasiliense TaxID=47480 RepID=A0ABT9RF18_9ACTN|nr:UbiA family prenyltransferase [Streptosporangium brasiliense]MDP9867426.1 4-hydroxybenzoate polyprenyltransferase [Streptosporangium brasiliense]